MGVKTVVNVWWQAKHSPGGECSAAWRVCGAQCWLRTEVFTNFNHSHLSKNPGIGCRVKRCFALCVTWAPVVKLLSQHQVINSDLLRWNTFLAENPGRKYPALQRVMAMILGGRALRELANSLGARTAL